MATKSFKQFLESETENLELMRYELFFRKEMNLSKAAAKAAVVWAKMAGQLNAPMISAIPDDGWDHITDWADAKYRAERGKSIYDGRSSGDVQLIVKALIARTMRENYGFELMAAPISESVEDLEELPYVLAVRKEYKMSKEQAQEVIDWLKGDKDWGDLEYDARGVFIEIWDPDTPDLHHPGMSYGDFVMDEVHMALKKYQLDTRELG